MVQDGFIGSAVEKWQDCQIEISGQSKSSVYLDAEICKIISIEMSKIA
jgi:hypothetical protein